jgi:lipopolysaccharide/colanic/teichoic acid biosynthesis glycosyltransferase
MTSRDREVSEIARRAIDIAVSLAALVLLSPAFALIAVALYWQFGSVLFRQVRAGLGGQPFTLVKFRTMSDARDAGGRPLPDAQRLGRLGLFLRAASIDELPELWNVLRGEMTLIGPRPLLMAYLDRYTPEQARRHDVKPGITGWAQVNGRNTISWEEKFALDVWYVDHRSWRLDLKILGMTAVTVFGHEGIGEPGCATATEFRGSK